MTAALPFDLAPPVRLALAYAPAAAQAVMLPLLALDQRLAQTVRGAKEPVLGQVKLAWWRERLGELPATPAGEPLLAALSAAGWLAADTVPLLDGWETALVSEDLAAAVITLASARGEACAALARRLGLADWMGRAGAAGRGWALADLAVHAVEPALSELAHRSLNESATPRQKFPRALRSLAILNGWAMLVANKPRDQLHPNWKDLVVIVRIGLFG